MFLINIYSVVFQPLFCQYNLGFSLVVSVCIVQNRTRPVRQFLDEVIRPSSCRVVTFVVFCAACYGALLLQRAVNYDAFQL